MYFWAKKLKSRDMDRADIISLLNFVDTNANLLKKLLEKYDKEGTLLRLIERVIVESRMEYKFLGLIYEKEGGAIEKPF